MGDWEGEVWGDGERQGLVAVCVALQCLVWGFLALRRCPPFDCSCCLRVRGLMFYAGRRIYASFLCMGRSACRDSVVLITRQHLCKSLEGVKVETLAKSMYFHIWDTGFPYLLTLFLNNYSIAKFLWNDVVLMQNHFSQTALT